MTAVEPYLQEEPVQIMLNLEAAGAISPVALNLSLIKDMPFEQYQQIGAFLGRVKRASSWWVGDFLVYGEGAYGEKFAQAAADTQLEEQTLRNYAYVCRQVPVQRRVAGVPFSCHAEVAPLTPKEQKYWLGACEKGGWSRAELRSRMKAKRKDEKPTIPGTDEESEATNGLVEVARAILRDVRPHEDDESLMILPRDDIARLEAALGGF